MELPILLLLLGIFLVPSFLLQRRQQKQQQQIRQMQDNLNTGDHVMTAAGLHGTIVALQDDTIVLEIADGVHTQWERISIVKVIEPAQLDGPVIVEEGTLGQPSQDWEKEQGIISEDNGDDKDRRRSHPENI